MDKKLLITISREYGSGGHAIAEMLSKKLDIPMFDKNIISIASGKSGISEDRLASEDERMANPFFEPYVAYGIDTGSLSERLFLTQSQIIKEKANLGSAIFVGRCSDYILEEYDHCYHFYIYAPRADRVERIMKAENIEEDMAAVKILKKIDKQRKSYYQFYTEKKWGDPAGKDLMINSSSLGIEGSAALILSFLRLQGYNIPE